MDVPREKRRVKGVNIVGFSKLLRARRKTHPLGTLAPEVAAMLDQRILATEWYPFPAFQGLVDLVDREVLHGNELGALQMGMAGGAEILQSTHKGFVRPGDAAATLLNMVVAWPQYFDWGELHAEREGSRAVRFHLDGYRDVSQCHGGLIVGWHVAAAIAAGEKNAKGIILERPWKGAPRLSHRVTF
jgi:hypothetical protein